MEIINNLKHQISKLLSSSRISENNPILNEKIRIDGCAVIENFLTRSHCEKLINIGNDIIDKFPNKVKHESNNSDIRIYGIDKLSNEFELSEITNEADEWARKFYRTNNITHFQMLGHIKYKEGNLGSGSGWHRDSPYKHQFKFILYLNDVTEDNGPFQYIKGSHTEEVICRYSKILGESYGKYRFTTEEVDKILNEMPESKISTACGGAGTLLIADVKGLHRGKPLDNGERWATTRYYYPGKIPDSLLKAI